MPQSDENFSALFNKGVSKKYVIFHSDQKFEHDFSEHIFEMWYNQRAYDSVIKYRLYFRWILGMF